MFSETIAERFCQTLGVRGRRQVTDFADAGLPGRRFHVGSFGAEMCGSAAALNAPPEFQILGQCSATGSRSTEAGTPGTTSDNYFADLVAIVIDLMRFWLGLHHVAALSSRWQHRPSGIDGAELIQPPQRH